MKVEKILSMLWCIGSSDNFWQICFAMISFQKKEFWQNILFLEIFLSKWRKFATKIITDQFRVKRILIDVLKWNALIKSHNLLFRGFQALPSSLTMHNFSLGTHMTEPRLARGSIWNTRGAILEMTLGLGQSHRP